MSAAQLAVKAFILRMISSGTPGITHLVDDPSGDFTMMLSRTVLITSSLALALFSGAAQAQPAAQGGKPMMTLQMPATPDPARVTLDPKSTALIVLDYVEDICNVQPSCKGQMLPAMTPFLERVRKAGLPVAYGTRQPNMTHWLKEVAPA